MESDAELDDIVPAGASCPQHWHANVGLPADAASGEPPGDTVRCNIGTADGSGGTAARTL
jgi:hypothetical protein